jgi:hypothetical protein
LEDDEAAEAEPEALFEAEPEAAEPEPEPEPDLEVAEADAWPLVEALEPVVVAETAAREAIPAHMSPRSQVYMPNSPLPTEV